MRDQSVDPVAVASFLLNDGRDENQWQTTMLKIVKASIQVQVFSRQSFKFLTLLIYHGTLSYQCDPVSKPGLAQARKTEWSHMVVQLYVTYITYSNLN